MTCFAVVWSLLGGPVAEGASVTHTTVLLQPPVRRVHDRHRSVRIQVFGAEPDVLEPLHIPGFALSDDPEPADLVAVMSISASNVGDRTEQDDGDEGTEVYYRCRIEGTVRLENAAGAVFFAEPFEVERKIRYVEPADPMPNAFEEFSDDAIRGTLPLAVRDAGARLAFAYGWRQDPRTIVLHGRRRVGRRAKVLAAAHRAAARGFALYAGEPDSPQALEELRAAVEGWEGVLAQMDADRHGRGGRLADLLHWNVGVVSIWLRDYDRARHYLFAAYGSMRSRFGEEGAMLDLANEMDELWTRHARAQSSPPDPPCRERCP